MEVSRQDVLEVMLCSVAKTTPYVDFSRFGSLVFPSTLLQNAQH